MVAEQMLLLRNGPPSSRRRVSATWLPSGLNTGAPEVRLLDVVTDENALVLSYSNDRDVGFVIAGKDCRTAIPHPDQIVKRRARLIIPNETQPAILLWPEADGMAVRRDGIGCVTPG